MAQRTTVLLVDDLDGGEAEETVEFALDGTLYEIDLSTGHAGDLRRVLAPYVAAARRTSGRGGGRPAPTAAADSPPRRSSTGSSAAEREQNRAVRAWANENGYALSPRGRIPSVVTDAYRRGDPSALSAAGTTDAGEPAPDPGAAPAPEVVDGDGAIEKLGPDGLTRAERERIRAWALEQGIEVKGRGRLTRDLISNYRATTARTRG